MSYNSKIDADFVHYLESMINLNALDNITQDLGAELQDSQQVMNQIKSMIDSLPKSEQDMPGPNYRGCRHEDLSKFLNDSPPNILMPDMVANDPCDVDLDNVLATVKSYTEDIKKNLVLYSQPETKVGAVKKHLEDINLDQYASCLEVLCKRLSNIKLNKNDEGNLRNPDLETKLAVLCDDVNMFTQMVQAKTTLGETNKNWTSTQQNDSLNYDQIINKLLSGINEVSYLLHSKK